MAYLNKVQSMTVEERDAHMLVDERLEGQAWPDYLDYVEEWYWTFQEKLIHTRKDFIYTVLAKKKQTILCGDHTHTFSDVKGADADVVFTRPDDYINVDSCWYKTILSTDQDLVYDHRSIDAVTLTTPEMGYLRKLVSIQIAVEGETTGELLPFSEFKRKWWNAETKERALKLVSESKPLHSLAQDFRQSLILNTSTSDTSSSDPIAPETTPMTKEDAIQQAIGELALSMPPPRPLWFGGHPDSDVIRTATSIEADHGLHSILLARTDSKAVFNTINEIRLSCSTDALDPVRLSNAMRKCHLCKDMTHRPNTTTPGFFYAPPGSGKSTALEKHLIVAVDTDWLITRSYFDDIIAPFLRMGVPVLTNQYHLAHNSGEKLIGWYNPHHLRNGPDGKPYTPVSEIEAARVAYSTDLCVLTDEQNYFAHKMLSLQRLNYVYNRTRDVIFKQKQPRKKYRETPPAPLDLQGFILEVRQWRYNRSRGRKRLKDPDKRRVESTT